MLPLGGALPQVHTVSVLVGGLQGNLHLKCQFLSAINLYNTAKSLLSVGWTEKSIFGRIE